MSPSPPGRGETAGGDLLAELASIHNALDGQWTAATAASHQAGSLRRGASAIDQGLTWYQDTRHTLAARPDGGRRRGPRSSGG